MGLLGRLTGWDQQKDAHNAVVASDFVDSASPATKQRIINRIIEIQRNIKGRYAGSFDEILSDLNNQPRSVQMNFVALACNSLGIQPNVRGLHFNDIQNPYLAKGEDTSERIDGVVKFINDRYLVRVSWPGDHERVNFTEWLGGASSNARAAYEHAVGEHLRETLGLDPQDNRLLALDELLDRGWNSATEPMDVALQIGIAFYVAQTLGDAGDRAEASQLYLGLRSAVHLASIAGQISSERAEEFLEIISRYTRMSVLKGSEKEDDATRHSKFLPKEPPAGPDRHGWKVTRRPR